MPESRIMSSSGMMLPSVCLITAKPCCLNPMTTRFSGSANSSRNVAGDISGPSVDA